MKYFIALIAVTFSCARTDAACSSPSGGIGSLDFQGSAFSYCDGTNWLSMNAGGDFLKDGSIAMTGNFNAGGNSILGNTTANGNLVLESTSDASKGYIILQPSGGNVGVGTTTPAANLEVDGNAKLGSSGLSVSGIGVCSHASFTATAGTNGKACAGLAVGAPVYCSPTQAPTTATTTWTTRVSTLNTVVIHLSANFGVSSVWKCFYVNP